MCRSILATCVRTNSEVGVVGRTCGRPDRNEFFWSQNSKRSISVFSVHHDHRLDRQSDVLSVFAIQMLNSEREKGFEKFVPEDSTSNIYTVDMCSI